MIQVFFEYITVESHIVCGMDTWASSPRELAFLVELGLDSISEHSKFLDSSLTIHYSFIKFPMISPMKIIRPTCEGSC